MLVNLKPNNDDMLVIQGRNFVKVAFQRQVVVEFVAP